jgi:hypothetical protein
MTPTPLLTRIKERAEPSKITQLFPVKMSPFARALAEKRLPVKSLYNGAFVPADSKGAA